MLNLVHQLVLDCLSLKGYGIFGVFHHLSGSELCQLLTVFINHTGLSSRLIGFHRRGLLFGESEAANRATYSLKYLVPHLPQLGFFIEMSLLVSRKVA